MHWSRDTNIGQKFVFTQTTSSVYRSRVDDPGSSNDGTCDVSTRYFTENFSCGTWSRQVPTWLQVPGRPMYVRANGVELLEQALASDGAV